MKNNSINKRKKILRGGDADGTSLNFNMHKLSIYYATVIMGYFGSKIFMGFYKVYSNKPSDREIGDFTTFTILSFLSYVFTGMNDRNVLGSIYELRKIESNYFYFSQHTFSVQWDIIICFVMQTRNSTARGGDRS